MKYNSFLKIRRHSQGPKGTVNGPEGPYGNVWTLLHKCPLHFWNTPLRLREPLHGSVFQLC